MRRHHPCPARSNPDNLLREQVPRRAIMPSPAASGAPPQVFWAAMIARSVVAPDACICRMMGGTFVARAPFAPSLLCWCAVWFWSHVLDSRFAGLYCRLTRRRGIRRVCVRQGWSNRYDPEAELTLGMAASRGGTLAGRCPGMKIPSRSCELS